MSKRDEMETYEAAYRDLLASPVPREGLPLSPGVARRIEMSRPASQDDDPYARLVRELDTIPVGWFL